jgi:hypothetical protein
MEVAAVRREVGSIATFDATRWGWLAGCTTNPDSGWVTQQARNLSFVELVASASSPPPTPQRRALRPGRAAAAHSAAGNVNQQANDTGGRSLNSTEECPIRLDRRQPTRSEMAVRSVQIWR